MAGGTEVLATTSFQPWSDELSLRPSANIMSLPPGIRTTDGIR